MSDPSRDNNNVQHRLPYWMNTGPTDDELDEVRSVIRPLAAHNVPPIAFMNGNSVRPIRSRHYSQNQTGIPGFAVTTTTVAGPNVNKLVNNSSSDSPGQGSANAPVYPDGSFILTSDMVPQSLKNRKVHMNVVSSDDKLASQSEQVQSVQTRQPDEDEEKEEELVEGEMEEDNGLPIHGNYVFYDDECKFHCGWGRGRRMFDMRREGTQECLATVDVQLEHAQP